MNKLLLSIQLLLLSFCALAKNENPTPVPYSPKRLAESNRDTIHQKVFDTDYFTEAGVAKPVPAGMKVKQNSITATLFVDPFVERPSASAFNITLDCRFSYKTIADPARVNSKTVRLSISYDPASATYKAKDFYNLANAAWADITVTKVISAPATFAENDSAFRLYLQYQAEKFIVPTASQLGTPVTVIDLKASSNNGYLKLSWQRPEPDWAERYDVEYLFVDNYNGTGGAKPAGSIPYNFRFNSTRVTTANTELEIPLVFEQGYIVARVRAVGMQGSNYDEPLYGNWDLAGAANSIPADVKHVFEITAANAHQADKMNWSYTGVFAGDDLHKESVNYADGTLRARQTVSTKHADQNLVVSEHIYDYQGRPAIQTLPAPVKPVYSAPAATGSGSSSGSTGTGFTSELIYAPLLYVNEEFRLSLANMFSLFSYRTTQPRIGFQSNFNLNSEGQPYSKADFDTDRDNVCNVSASPFNTNSGAGKYYSPNNADLSGFNKFIPDAEGYPFTQITYTPDKTNRPAIVAKAGAGLKLGSSHEQKVFYGAPSQDELDRMFGNDAGVAAHYKKEMLLDENGQAHVTFKDIKGNEVATALAGDAPAAYEAIPHGDAANITLHLIEEDNRLDEATKSLVSQKSLLLSKTTSVNFSYRLTPPTLTGTYCNGTSYCYDCVYDLEIVVRNACGDSVWGRKQAIGTLTPLNTCSAAEVNFSGVASALPAGNYFISKRLTVNATALQQYVNDYSTRYVCAQPLQPYLPAAGLAAGNNPCSQPCNECRQIPAAVGRSFAMVQPDGSTRNVSLPVSQRATGQGDCVRNCSQGFPSPCATALEAMLADVSPGGQYAEYLDTTRRDAMNPRGVFNAKVFPVSVLNDSANNLPIRGANWRNPIYNYQNKDGSEAYIEIGTDGLPAHRDLEILERDGKQFVKPRYLEYAADFVRYWQPQWAEALVAYHPEYGYYSWCLNHQSSYAYDTLMRATQTYTDAVARNVVNHRTLGAAIDPFFRDGLPADAVAMNAALNNFSPLAGYADLNIDEAVYMAVNCNNVNFSAAEANNCARGKVLYANAATANKEWNFYKDFYLFKKHTAHDNARRNWIAANNLFDNTQIGANSFGAVANPIYSDRVKRFNDSKDGLTYLPVDMDSVTPESLYAWRDAAFGQMQQSCGGCGSGYELTAFLNALVLEKKLQQSLVIPSVTPLIFSKGMTRLFADSLATRYNWTTAASANSLGFTVSTLRGTQCVINLTKSAPYNWDSIIRLDCFTATGLHEFTLRARTATDSTFTVTGSSACINFRTCPAPTVCTKEPAANEMAVLMKYIFQRGRYRSTSVVLRGASGYTPHLGAALRSVFPAATRWEWKMKTISYPDTTLTAEIAITNPARTSIGTTITSYVPQASIERCNFTLRVITPGFKLSDVADVVNISQPANTTACAVNEFIITAKTSKGALFQIRGQSCFKLYNCCQNQNTTTTPALCCVPVMPKFDLIPTCLRNAEAVANNNRARDESDRLTAAIDSFRIKYIARCLGAAEELNAAYTDAIYQITLMYYDRSGQLIKTVPPMGVKILTGAQVAAVRQARSTGSGLTYPAHTMATTYRYNSLNQVVETTSPDEGTKRFCYDENGRSIMSQDATQLAANACSYTLYDEMGRVLESGRMSFSGGIPSFNYYENFKTALAASVKTEFKKRKYDEMPAAVVSKFPAPPKNLRNRLAALEAYEASGNLQHAMYFDYDALGNTKNLVQNFKGISTGDGSKFWKKVNYDYNPVSGKVKRVWYQKGNTDQLIHWYQYDADGKMISAQTGTNPNELEILRETEARYFYYPHGPLARTEIGTEKVQGIDYAYTINGLVKGINSGNASADFDMGEDGKPEGILHGHFPADAFGEALNYFDDDYRAVSSSAVAFNTAATGTLQTGFSLPVYNGFIRNTISTIPGIDTKPQARAFKYDQAGRFSQMQTIFDLGAVTSNSISAGFTEDYKMQITYDANGNIKTLLRNKNSGAAMDNLTYQYGASNNQLQSMDDAVSNTADANDIDDQSANNYTYDGCGRLKTDAAAGVSEMVWNNAGNIKRIAKAGSNIEYGYDAFNRRAWKKDGGNTDFYVRDAKGNLLATYRANGSAVTCNTLDIYGDTRLGQYELNKEVEPTTPDTGSFRRGLKRYELTNHIGDVQAVVSDKRALVSGIVKADVISAFDYYPFGMPMPGRKAGSRNYQYGFQGMECDDAVAGDNNEYNTEFRQYDPRVARWLSVDPKAGNFFALSPYNAMLNNAVNFSDSKGADPTEDRTRGVRLRPEDDRLLREMLEWGDDPIAGIEDPPVDAIDALCINLRRLEGNDDPLAGLPMEDASEPAPARRRTGHRRHREGTAEILRVDEAPFEDEHVEGRAPRRRAPTVVEAEEPDGGVIMRDAFADAGDIMDAGGVVNDVVTVADWVNDARSAGEVLTVRDAAGVLMNGSRSVGGLGLLGAGVSVVNMVGDIYDDANALVDGDIGVGTYAARSTCNVVGGTVGVVPLIGAPISRGIGYFRDWVAPRPEH